MNHKHSCQCEHKHVKYCKVCHVVHCLDCNQEWNQKQYWTYYNNYPFTNTTTGTYPYLGQATAQTMTTTADSVCKHGE